MGSHGPTVFGYSVVTTLMRVARSGSTPDEILEVAKVEGVDPNKLRMRVAEGRVIILRNTSASDVKPVGVGEGLRTKVNVNVGTSTHVVDVRMEVEKVRIAKRYGADSVMDLSIGGDLDSIRRTLIREARPLPVGTVPTYQVWMETVARGRGLPDEDYFIKIVERHLKDGVDFMTIHAAITRELALKAVRSSRVQPIVSRGGALLAAWMLETGEENPYWKNFDYILELFAEYDAVISLGDSLRPGSVFDALDELHVRELVNNARLVERAREYGVMAMVEGPGHVPLDKIVEDVKLMKALTRGAPYYVLGPVVTEVAPGYDHITAAIGAAIAAAAGADFICYVTPAEHLSLPTPEQVKEGLIAARIAAHAADIVKLGEKALSWDRLVAEARARLDWDTMIAHSIDPERARSIRMQFKAELASCTMCGSLCAMLVLEKWAKRLSQHTIVKRSA